MASADPKDVKKIPDLSDIRKAIEDKASFCTNIDDTKKDIMPMSTLRVRNCKVIHFCRKLPEQDYRLFHSLTKTLYVRGNITSDNFQKLIECAKELEHLYLSDGPMSTDCLMMNLCNNESFKEFWDNLSKLAIEVTLFGCEESEIIRKNMICLMGCNMNHLKCLSLEVYNYEIDNCLAIINSVIAFLANHPTLGTLQVVMTQTVEEEDPLPLADNLEEKLAQLKLESLTLAISDCFWKAWARLINTLKTLKTLKVSILDMHGFNCENTPESFPTNRLKDVLENNRDSLTCIYLDVNCIPAPVNAEDFKGMPYLKRLVLCNCNRPKKEIVNLKLLPASLECLELHELTGEGDDIDGMKSSLKNLHRIRPVGFGKHDTFKDRAEPRQTLWDDEILNFFDGRDPFEEASSDMNGLHYCELVSEFAGTGGDYKD